MEEVKVSAQGASRTVEVKRKYQIQFRQGGKSMEAAVKRIVERDLRWQTRDGKYLTFSLGGEDYGIAIMKIKEIIGMLPVTSVPRTPPFVKGVINLRGQVIPVISLRLKFDLREVDYNERTSIIVVEKVGEESTALIGVVVDSVCEVINIRGDDIEDSPAFGGSMDAQYVLGMAKIGGRVKILVDIDRVLTGDELTLLDNVA